MVLFKKPEITVFNRLELINRIKNSVQEKYPNYHIIDNSEGEAWDLLIIRSVTKEIREVIGMNNHEKIENKTFQQIFAVLVSNDKELDKPLIESISKVENWVTQHMVTNRLETVMRRLET